MDCGDAGHILLSKRVADDLAPFPRWRPHLHALDDMEVKSVKKKLKDKAFARSVNRDDIYQGAEELGVELDDHIRFVIDALKPVQKEIGLGPREEQATSAW